MTSEQHDLLSSVYEKLTADWGENDNLKITLTLCERAELLDVLLCELESNVVEES